jgi:hypothetical protein
MASLGDVPRATGNKGTPWLREIRTMRQQFVFLFASFLFTTALAGAREAPANDASHLQGT